VITIGKAVKYRQQQGCGGAEMDRQSRPKLSDAEKQEPYATYYHRESAKVSSSVTADIERSPYPSKDALPFERINDLLTPGYLPIENGYAYLPDGSVYVAVLTEMPKVTGEMLDWWFWWHPMSSLRYKIWYPEAHFAASMDVDQHVYQQRKGPYRERYWNTTNYPVEDVGIGKDTLSITFVPPSDFGFDETRFEEADVATVVCGIVGSVTKKLRQFAHMCHFARKNGEGVELRSRFWIGYRILKDGVPEKSVMTKLINKRAAKRLLLPRNAGIAMATHCAQEYSNLAEILPELYATYEGVST
jgi:hypothetical protein